MPSIPPIPYQRGRVNGQRAACVRLVTRKFSLRVRPLGGRWLVSRFSSRSPSAMAFVQQPAEDQVRTNNHVERLTRRLRFAEKVRYRWRKRKWVVRWVVLLLDVCWQEAAVTASSGSGTKQSGERSPPQLRVGGKRKVA